MLSLEQFIPEWMPTVTHKQGRQQESSITSQLLGFAVIRGPAPAAAHQTPGNVCTAAIRTAPRPHGSLER